jgi:polysaccharide biosynthesis protein PslH
MKILVISPNLPYPTDTGGSIRIFNLIKNLSRENEIDLLSYDYGSTNEEWIKEIKILCTHVHLIAKQRQSALRQVVDVTMRFLRNEPYSLKYAESKGMKKAIKDLTTSNRYDVVQIEHSYAAGMYRHIHKWQNTRTVLSLHNIASQQYHRIYQHEKSIFKRVKLAMDWLPMRSWEPATAMKFDKVVVVSDSDRETLKQKATGANIYVIPNGIDTASQQPIPMMENRKNVLIVGTLDYEPNVDAILYFNESIFPLLLDKASDATLTIVGRNPGPEIESLADDRSIRIAANVPDVRRYYQEAAVSAVPLRSGGGTRIKILESMALGVPVVSTSIGCEGLEAIDGDHILIADRPADFAQKIYDVISDINLAKRIAENARRLIENKYDWNMIAQQLNKAYLE